ncbi:HAD-IA family hydrolase [Rhizobium sp. LjRoot254]|uniref:HAD-IA family hydrolase n=1 Tax=Rhizobium sp. LjRoot254 TaxID=3342297 RepID=UPI003ECD76CE
MKVVKGAQSERTKIIRGLVKHKAFDHQFYSTSYMKGAADRQTAAEHFVAHSALDYRTPNPRFDAWAYAASNPDVRESGYHPFVHFLAHGAKEGRKVAPLSAPSYQDAVTISELCASKQRVRNVRIAIMVHLFYEDYLPLLVKRLDAFPYPFDLFISCRSDAAKEEALEALATSKQGHLSVEVVPNRGRNIAPLLVTFGRQLADYDLVGHVHTKKSLYTGSEKREWSNHLFSGVLGTPDYAEGVIKAFLSDEKLNIVSSEIFYDLPFWALHELSNSDKLRSLAQRLEVSTGGEFIDYPVGGMFWTRGSVLKRLLGLNLDFESFDKEAGQIDGTIHHAIERLLGLVAAENGGRFLKYSPRHGLLYADNNQWLRLYEKLKRSDLNNAMTDAEVCSFDFFDTLIARNAAEVEEAKILISERLSDRSFGEHADYRAYRNASELAARERKNWQGDVGFLEIAREMTRFDGVSLDDALEWLHEEARADISIFERREALVRLYDGLLAEGKRVIIVSDTFYNRAFIKDVMTALKIQGPSEFYLSSELGKRKDRGDLWAHVVKSEGAGICHVGDNVVSDVQNPTNFGVTSFFAAKMYDKARWMGVLKGRPDRNNWKLVAPIVRSLGDEPYFS